MRLDGKNSMQTTERYGGTKLGLTDTRDNSSIGISERTLEVKQNPAFHIQSARQQKNQNIESNIQTNNLNSQR